MARPLRLAYPGALARVTSHGKAQQRLVADDEDRHALVAGLEAVLRRVDPNTLTTKLLQDVCGSNVPRQHTPRSEKFNAALGTLIRRNLFVWITLPMSKGQRVRAFVSSYGYK